MESNFTLREQYEFVKSNIELLREYPSYRHPNGFYAFIIGGDDWGAKIRLHVWLDENTTQDLHPHDHIYDINSYVCFGSIVQKLYTEEGCGQYDSIEVDYGKNGEYSHRILRSGVALNTCGLSILHAGEEYTLKGRVAHVVHAHRAPSATIFKAYAPSRTKATVYVPSETEFVVDERTPLARSEIEEIMWQIRTS